MKWRITVEPPFLPSVIIRHNVHKCLLKVIFMCEEYVGEKPTVGTGERTPGSAQGLTVPCPSSTFPTKGQVLRPWSSVEHSADSLT